MTPSTQFQMDKPDTTQAVLKKEEALPPDLAKRAVELARTLALDPSRPETVANAGSQTQAKAGEVAEQLLQKVKVKDSGEAGKLLSSLTLRLRSVDVKKLSGGQESHGFLSKVRSVVMTHVVSYQETLTAVDTLVTQLTGARTTILDDVTFLGKLYDMNLGLYQDLQLWIEALKIKRDELDQTLIPAAEQKAQGSSNPLDGQAVNDLKTHRQRVDKRIYDLELTKMTRLQNAPKIRLIQAGDISLAEQLQSSVVNGVPLFKENLSLAIVQSRQKEAAQVQQDFSDGLNDLIKQGADMLHDNSVQIATQAQRGIIDFDTLQHQQEQLLRTIDDVAKIAEDGAKNRETVRQGLTEMESNLQKKLAK